MGDEKEKMSFEFELGQEVYVGPDGEIGQIRGRAKYVHEGNKYFIRYITTEDRSFDAWFEEDELSLVD